jgi:hypothetical protein
LYFYAVADTEIDISHVATGDLKSTFDLEAYAAERGIMDF